MVPPHIVRFCEDRWQSSQLLPTVPGLAGIGLPPVLCQTEQAGEIFDPGDVAAVFQTLQTVGSGFVVPVVYASIFGLVVAL